MIQENKPKIEEKNSDKSDKSDPLRYTQTLSVITTPIKYWVYISVITAAGVMAWSIFGKIPEKATAKGVLLNPYQINSILEPSKSEGIYTNIYVKKGELVKKGDVLAAIKFDDLNNAVTDAEENVINAQQEHIKKFESNSFYQLKNQQKQAEINSLRYFNTAKKIAKSGSISESSVSNAQQQYEQAIQTKLTTIGDIESSLQNIQSLKRKVITAKQTKADISLVKSPFAGRVLEVYVRPGNANTPNNTLLILDSKAKESNKREDKLSLIAYYNATEAAKILPGQSVHILPNNIKANTVGNLYGIVNSVNKTPSSITNATAILGSEDIAKDLVVGDSNIQVIVNLIPDKKFSSGYKWINGNGPPSTKKYQYPTIGIFASSNVITKRVAPITIGIPALKRFFGIE